MRPTYGIHKKGEGFGGGIDALQQRADCRRKLHQCLLHALQQDVFGQVNANKHQFAVLDLVRRPGRPQIAAHELVHALENHLALGAQHVQHALVAQHARAVDIDDGAEKVFQLGRIKGTLGLEHKALHVIVVVMVVALLVMQEEDPLLNLKKSAALPALQITVLVLIMTVLLVLHTAAVLVSTMAAKVVATATTVSLVSLAAVALLDLKMAAA